MKLSEKYSEYARNNKITGIIHYNSFEVVVWGDGVWTIPTSALGEILVFIVKFLNSLKLASIFSSSSSFMLKFLRRLLGFPSFPVDATRFYL